MHIIKGYQPDLIESETAVALGMFDGVHLGHKKILQKTIEYAKENDLKSAAIVLSSHPRLLIEGKSPPLLTDLDSKLLILKDLGLDIVLLLDFTSELREMDPELYVRRFLEDTLKAKFVAIGYDHHFGKERSGGPIMLKEWSIKKGVKLFVCDPVNYGGELVSSSKIRNLIAEGEIEKANALLGHEYFLRGNVVEGDSRGRELGFPTANIETLADIAMPKTGVYSGEAYVLSRKARFKCVVNIGSRPTFKDDGEISFEAHLLNYDGEIYGEKIEIYFQKRLRDEKKFSNKEDLIEQIKKDIEHAS